MFVTSQIFSGDLVTEANNLITPVPPFSDGDGLAAGDAICQHLANDAALDGTYKAWLSTSSAWPADGTRFTQAQVPYKLVDGTPVADGWSDLITCDPECLDAPIDRTETGGGAGMFDSWTGTTERGDFLLDFPSCAGWHVDHDGVIGLVGGVGLVHGGWTFFQVHGCDIREHLYCFEQ